MNLRQAAQQALKEMDDHMYRADTHEFYEAKEALRAALAEPDSDYERGFVDGMNLQTKGSVDKAVNRMAQTTHWEGCEAVHPECKTELERKSNAIQRLWKERDELLSENRTLVRQNGEWQELNAELVEALRWIDMRCPAILLDHPLHRGLHMEAAYDAGACARAALAKVEASK